jgi:4-amino-4-deoxy-L-arabinose transferase-like glycosyltransferase
MGDAIPGFSTDAGGTPIGTRGAILAALALAAMVFVYPLGLGLPLLDPDEGLHAAIAQEMVEKGDWLTPRLQGVPFLDKPILFFWAQALSLWSFGAVEWAVRLPGMFFGLLGVATTTLVGWRMLGRTTGIVAGLFYATMILPVALTQAATHDAALVPWVNLAILLFWEADRPLSRRASAGFTAAVGLVLGLAILTKGLTGVALVAVAYGGHLSVARRLTWGAALRGGVALLVGLALAAGWYWAVEARNPGYLHYYFVERHLLGFATSTQTHGREPGWYYLPVLLAGGLPWLGYLPHALRDLWLRRSEPDRHRGSKALLGCWLLGGTLLLTIARSKLLTYLWPVFPALAVLCALGWARLLEGTLDAAIRRSLARGLTVSCLLAPPAASVGLLAVERVFAVRLGWPAWTVAIAAALTAWMAPVLLARGRAQATLFAATLCVGLQCPVWMTAVLPSVAATTSARDLAAHFNRQGRLPPQLLVADERIASLLFYLHPALRSGLRTGQIEAVKLGALSGVEPRPGAILALADQKGTRRNRASALGGLRCEAVGRYRLYDAAAVRTALEARQAGLK